ncbi:MAG: NADP-dependent oxidoreductase [Thermoplasmata archaeon]|nr:NADP-dependent oxidoreductase [Thermoplasmata archaeon]
MSVSMNRRWLFEKRPEGPVGAHNFRWTQAEIPSPGEGQMLVRNLWLDVAPTQVLSLTAPPEAGGRPPGTLMEGFASSQVIESRIPQFSPGDIIYAASGWEDYSVIDGKGYWDAIKVSPGVSPNLAAGALGITGIVAYFGVTEVATPRPGETFVVSAAAGGVGSIAAQVAKILGLRVIGIAGGKEKRDWLLSEARVDGAIDHRSEKVASRLDALCPEGIDIYFDNVGGPILDLALERLRSHGRIVLCGTTARYRPTTRVPGPLNYAQLIMVNGRMEGLLGRDYFHRFPEAIASLKGWLDSGQLKTKEDVVVGLEYAPAALARLFSGDNVGKQLVKIADPPLNVDATKVLIGGSS